MYTVTSEIYEETNFKPTKGKDGRVVSKFVFKYPSNGTDGRITIDKDGDLVVPRRCDNDSDNEKCGVIEIQHSEATEIRLVGLQVWRGALLLADFIFHKREELKDKQILELGAGVGLTSIAAGIFANKITCTDVDIGGILDLIRANVRNNKKLCHNCEIDVLEYDFMLEENNYSQDLIKVIDESDIVLAADVIYDNDLTNAFIRVIDVIFHRESISGKKKVIYIALEKRYVFTMSEFDLVAPMFEYFLNQTLQKTWKFHYIQIDFPQYFQYERCKHLVLLKITSS